MLEEEPEPYKVSSAVHDGPEEDVAGIDVNEIESIEKIKSMDEIKSIIPMKKITELKGTVSPRENF